MKEIIAYKFKDGKCPFDEWIANLDISVQTRIVKRMERVRQGNLGDWKKLDSDISELRFNFGPGYRIYFSEVDNVIMILLCAGDKSTQSKDIKKAKEYLKDLLERTS